MDQKLAGLLLIIVAILLLIAAALSSDNGTLAALFGLLSLVCLAIGAMLLAAAMKDESGTAPEGETDPQTGDGTDPQTGDSPDPSDLLKSPNYFGEMPLGSGPLPSQIQEKCPACGKPFEAGMQKCSDCSGLRE